MKQSTRKIIIDLLGWYGVLAILMAFALNNFEVLTARDVVYQLLNLTGAIGIIVSSLAKKDFQPVILNCVWLLIAVIALIKISLGGV